ncbi:MAG: tetratricopeptide repeat protein [Candidatus Nitrosotenuis sp.]
MDSAKLYKSGVTELSLGNHKKAFAIFRQVLDIEPSHTGALVKQGNILGKFARYDEAITYYDRALAVEPKNELALLNKGLALHYLERFEEAIACYDQVLQTRPDSTITKYNKASSLVRCGKVDDGIDVLADAIKVDFSYKYKAQADIDFESIRESPKFVHLVDIE